MKINTPLLIGFLVISMLLNAAGIVFFILFLSEHGHNKSVRREKAALERNLAVVRSGNIINQVSASDSVQKRLFVSQFDGQMDTFAFQAPQVSAGSLDYILVVYLHGMGSNQMEPFVTPAEQPLAAYISRDNPKVAVLSCNYRKEASWGNDAAISDVIQNTREIMQEYPFKTIVLMGTSMGGCVALNLAATAPEDIKSKIAGVVSMESAGDLK
ncbi:MAG: alpha/beta hydrolase, partial [Candidatus Obscuribacterales bacterium]|nr:alpha/beta hydrolase [Candidatus Obscuribacterales bacterium]